MWVFYCKYLSFLVLFEFTVLLLSFPNKLNQSQHFLLYLSVTWWIISKLSYGLIILFWSRTENLAAKLWGGGQESNPVQGRGGGRSRRAAHLQRHVLSRYRAGIFKQSVGARDRVGIGLSYRPARLHRLAESIPGLHKRLQIRAQDAHYIGHLALAEQGWENGLDQSRVEKISGRRSSLTCRRREVVGWLPRVRYWIN
jgi:hypothetical protein